ncbi:hypothetical protein BDY21DRAFT_333870 [Lineolata rhizophorae]|uniref:Mitochondrial ATPase inhibitor, IATP-domain-containing protein n=1 Tax=Lineolata rhizophorae TaxID=578093 RepID=A0A6A6PAR0_9PEZI|nr:hypothetical protein BDY21DRAFT_333870 [Lineolata rhizophorae]
MASAPLRNVARLSPHTPLNALLARRGFAASTGRYAGKESSLGRYDERAQEIESEKEDLLKKQKEGKGQWKDELASDSESMVKADRGETGVSSQETIQQLQKETEKLAQQKK